MSITVSNLTLDTNEVQLREFLSYCGDITFVKFGAPLPDGTTSAVVAFASPDSVEIAELLSGAAINGNQIRVVSDGGRHAIDPSTPRRSAVSAVDGLSAQGLLQGGKDILATIHTKAQGLDAKYGITDKVVYGAGVVKGAAVGVVREVTGRSDKGAATVQCWHWRPNQPQWGADPRQAAALRSAFE